MFFSGSFSIRCSELRSRSAVGYGVGCTEVVGFTDGGNDVDVSGFGVL